MDFIEQWLGISPDGGSGSLEIALLLLLAFVLCAIVARPAYGGPTLTAPHPPRQSPTLDLSSPAKHKPDPQHSTPRS